jgi:hypothetical protein
MKYVDTELKTSMKYYDNQGNEIKTRNNNGWIVKDSWLDGVCDFFSGLCCKPSDNNEVNLNLSKDSYLHENIQ